MSFTLFICFTIALPKEYQRIGKAFQNLSSVFTSSGYQGTEYKYRLSVTCNLEHLRHFPGCKEFVTPLSWVTSRAAVTIRAML